MHAQLLTGLSGAILMLPAAAHRPLMNHSNINVFAEEEADMAPLSLEDQGHRSSTGSVKGCATFGMCICCYPVTSTCFAMLLMFLKVSCSRRPIAVSLSTTGNACPSAASLMTGRWLLRHLPYCLSHPEIHCQSWHHKEEQRIAALQVNYPESF